MPNETLTKFNYPASLIHEYGNWVVLLRPDQITLGSLVLACKSDAGSMGELSAATFAELAAISSDLENTLRDVFQYDKINYLLLMMVDKNVHFHVLPRYASDRSMFGTKFVDSAWPGPPILSQIADVSNEQYELMLNLLKNKWP
jgi:diadenosine tetraphosphate (Ap4A) HIT family hydrolase